MISDSIFVDAGLPNITGFTQYHCGRSSSGSATWSSGALTLETNNSAIDGFNKSTKAYAAGVRLDASKYNTIYGSSGTVTPLSMKTAFYIKFA